MGQFQLAAKEDLGKLKTELDAHFSQMGAKFDHLEARLEHKLTLKLGSIMVVGIGLLATLMTIFHLQVS